MTFILVLVILISTKKLKPTAQLLQDNKCVVNYWIHFINLDFDYDKRNQKFQTSSGFRSFYSLDLPVISDTNTIKNYYSHSYYFDLFEKNISSLSVYMETANSMNNKDIKLSERISIPSKIARI